MTTTPTTAITTAAPEASTTVPARVRHLADLLLPPTSIAEGWEDQAACQGMETEWFYPERGESHHEQRTVCAGCPVRRECLTMAVERREKFGVWGGSSERQRRDLRSHLRHQHQLGAAA